MNLPEPFTNVMITYKKPFFSGPYGTKVEVLEVTRRGFYSSLFENFAIPPDWRHFNGKLLPHGFGGDHISKDEVIKWEYCYE